MRFFTCLALFASCLGAPFWSVQAASLTTETLPAPRSSDPRDEAADQLWRLRAALNVAALQCQFSPFLGTVHLYNNILRQHDGELKKAYQHLSRHYQRAPQGLGAFDRYNTRTYNGFATFDAQEQFCDTAALVGREALRQPLGQFSSFAPSALARLQASLTPAATTAWRPAVNRSYLLLPDISKCKARKPCPRS